jgi:hypothetical protein
MQLLEIHRPASPASTAEITSKIIPWRASVEFDVTASGEACVDLANSILRVRAKITRLNDDDLNAADMVGPVNRFVRSEEALLTSYDSSFQRRSVGQTRETPNSYPLQFQE